MDIELLLPWDVKPLVEKLYDSTLCNVQRCLLVADIITKHPYLKSQRERLQSIQEGNDIRFFRNATDKFWFLYSHYTKLHDSIEREIWNIFEENFQLQMQTTMSHVEEKIVPIIVHNCESDVVDYALEKMDPRGKTTKAVQKRLRKQRVHLISALMEDVRSMLQPVELAIQYTLRPVVEEIIVSLHHAQRNDLYWTARFVEYFQWPSDTVQSSSSVQSLIKALSELSDKHLVPFVIDRFDELYFSHSKMHIKRVLTTGQTKAHK